jgi:biotin---protein ligase
LNKADGGPGFVKVIDELLLHDSGRSALLRAMLIKLGLRVYPEEDERVDNDSPDLTPFHVSSSGEALNLKIRESLASIADVQDAEQEIFTINEVNDTFHVQYITSPLDSMRDLSQCLNGRYRSKSLDPTPKRIFIHPSPMTYGYFSPKEYFLHLPSTSKVGQSLAYVEVTTSTQTVLDKNPTLLKSLPAGFVIVATSQLNGRGRAGNAWISPRGSLAFSFLVRLPRTLSFRLVFVQYLVSLAVVEAIRTYDAGWEDVNVSIKWPNDVYGKPRHSDRWEKIGGIIINSTFVEEDFILVIGCGINTTNPHPTTSLLNIIPERLHPPTHERLLAKILTTFSNMYDEFLRSGFREFENTYYQRWLHQGQIVSIEHGMARGRIRGVNFEDRGSGGLIVDEVDAQDRPLGRKPVEVVADGNSFDMMKGLLRKKT